MTRILVDHARRHVIAYLALACALLALGGAAYASFTLPPGSVGERQIQNRGVGVLVDVGGLGVLVAEPQRDRRDVDVLGWEEHRVGVPQCVGGDALGFQRRAAGCSRGGVLVE
jgi:hypothetical protein